MAEEKDKVKEEAVADVAEGKADLQNQLQEKQNKIEELDDRFKRVLAEFENYKKLLPMPMYCPTGFRD